MTNKYYYQLILFQRRYPELTFQNDGYEYLSLDIREKYKEQIEKISKILKITIPRFKKFNNFKLMKNGSFCVRCQYMWDERFTGVGYFPITDFKFFEKTKEK